MDKQINTIRPYHLQITSSALLLSLLFFIYYSSKNVLEIILAILLIFSFLFSQLFWKNPIQYSNIHKIDAILAKISIISFILYSLIYKRLDTIFLFLYLCIIFFLLYSFYLSNYFSNKEWCGSSHLFYHGISHIVCVLASLCAFI